MQTQFNWKSRHSQADWFGHYIQDGTERAEWITDKNREHFTEFSYSWLHIPTGKGGVTSALFASRDDFDRLIARWDASNPEVWRYSPAG